MYKLKRVFVVVMSLVVLVTLTACGKGAEGQLKGKSFELVEESGDVLGDITFEDNGEYRVKDKDPFSGEGVGKYEVVSKEDKDYLLIKSTPDNAGKYFEETEPDIDENYFWELDIDNLTLMSLVTKGKDYKKFDEYGSNDILKDPDIDSEYVFKLLDKK